ncbi:pyocin activator PrtN family protein [Mesorhizobium sp. M0488]|uniref:pyocin activator PrtN family protein n=1 Tax=unclassified Mesorhizobium TaxID=325217 RepID=UPI00333D7C81
MNAAARLSTQFLLMAQYGAVAIIPVEQVCRDYFSHLTPEKFLRKVGAGDIAIPVVKLEGSQKAARGVHIQHLADYIDALKEAAYEDCRKLNGRIG